MQENGMKRAAMLLSRPTNPMARQLLESSSENNQVVHSRCHNNDSPSFTSPKEPKDLVDDDTIDFVMEDVMGMEGRHSIYAPLTFYNGNYDECDPSSANVEATTNSVTRQYNDVPSNKPFAVDASHVQLFSPIQCAVPTTKTTRLQHTPHHLLSPKVLSPAPINMAPNTSNMSLFPKANPFKKTTPKLLVFTPVSKVHSVPYQGEDDGGMMMTKSKNRRCGASQSPVCGDTTGTMMFATPHPLEKSKDNRRVIISKNTSNYQASLTVDPSSTSDSTAQDTEKADVHEEPLDYDVRPSTTDGRCQTLGWLRQMFRIRKQSSSDHDGYK